MSKITKGYQYGVGATMPSVTAQFTPLHWQVAVSWGPGSLALALGPFAIRFDVTGWWPEVRAGWFSHVKPWADNLKWERKP